MITRISNKRATAPIVAETIAPMMPETMTMPQLGEDPSADECADDAQHDVADKAEAVTLDDQAGEPSGDGSDQYPNQQQFE